MVQYLRIQKWPVQILAPRLDGSTSIRVVGYVRAPAPEVALARAIHHWPEHRGRLAIPVFYRTPKE